uniref:TPR_REGION domain-containing protein n=1 Tax=Heterorhabditis bacteriophora TaxID=37862 RepID=A0A1I7XB09_HETBA
MQKDYIRIIVPVVLVSFALFYFHCESTPNAPPSAAIILYKALYYRNSKPSVALETYNEGFEA